MNLPYIEFFDKTAIGTLFQNIRVMLFVVMPILMIWAAIQWSGYLLEVIASVFRRKTDEERYDDKDYD